MYLVASIGLQIRRRIVHVHNADENVPTPNAIKARMYREPLRRACLQLADKVVGISNHTLDTFLAGRARRPDRDVVHYYGIDAASFEGPAPDRVRFRRELGLPTDALILLFAGRLVPEKNPVFAVDVFAELARREPRTFAVFAGAGSLEEAVRARAKALGVTEGLRMLGWRSDLPEIMRSADWFILPRPEHPMEGFGLAVVEAQLAGLRLLLSKGLPDDPLLPTAHLQRLRLGAGAVAWAEAADDLMQGSAPSQTEALAALRASPMEIDHAFADLMRLYD